MANTYDFMAGIQSGQNWMDRIFQQRAQIEAGRSLAAGNAQGAASRLYGAGNLEGGRAVVNQAATERTAAETARTASSARQLQTTQQIVKALKAQRDAGQDISAALPQYRATFLAMGTRPEDYDAIAAQITANPDFLDQVDAITAKQLEWELRGGNNGDTVAVAINPETGETRSRLAYAAPQAPQVTPLGIINPPARELPVGQDTAYQPGTSTGAANIPQGAPAPQAPLTGPSISSSPLWERQKQQESGGRQFDSNGQVLTSPKGAFGIAQLMPGTAADLARQMGVTVEQLRSDPALNEAAGQRYQQQLERRFGDEALALAAYNAGPGKVDEWIQRFGDPRTGEITTEEFVSRIPYSETRNYVQNITQGEYTSGGGQQAPQGGVEDLGGGYTLQRMQTTADARADRTEARLDRAELRAEADRNRRARTLTPQEVSAQGFPEGSIVQERPDGSLNVVAGAKAEKYTEGQRNAAYFSYRLNGARDTLAQLSQRGVTRPSPAILAFGEGRIRENALPENDRLWLQASRNWLAPILRKDTGAAITAPEVVFYMGEYLPSPTDSPAVIRQKADARRRAEDALRGLAGGAYEELYPQAASGNGPGGGNQRRPQTNTGVVPFDLSPQQLQTWRDLGRSGGDASRPRGDRLNPIPLNPAPNASARSWQNIPSGAYFIHPDGTTRRKP